MHILFQGDSITDCNRERDPAVARYGNALGGGYANHAAMRLLRENPDRELEFTNRGVGGNRIGDLYARWREDTINLKPDIITILVGINDLLKMRWEQNDGTEVKRFEFMYRHLLHYTREQLPEVKLFLAEPFAYPCGMFGEAWTDDLTERREIVEQLANESGATFIPSQSIFAEAFKTKPGDYWLWDGVHPTPAGHALMADAWVKALSPLIK